MAERRITPATVREFNLKVQQPDMNYKVASSFGEVLEAWCLVYRQYLAASLIGPNEFSIFTFPEYISNNTAVIIGKDGGQTVCTASAVLDSDRGLPLDNYYKNELDQLRAEGRNLIEVGLVADSRKLENFSNVIELMNGIARFGVYSKHLDYVVGIHPRRVNLYNRLWGFKPFGQKKDYAALKTAPVVLLHLSGLDPQTRSLEMNQEIYSNTKDYNFDTRYKFNPQNFITSNEFSASVESFIRKIWHSKNLQRV